MIVDFWSLNLSLSDHISTGPNRTVYGIEPRTPKFVTISLFLYFREFRLVFILVSVLLQLFSLFLLFLFLSFFFHSLWFVCHAQSMKKEISSSCSANAWEPNAKLTFHLIKNDNNTNTNNNSNNSNSNNNKIKWSSFKWNVSWRRATLHQTIMFIISQHRWDSYAYNAIWCCDYC